MKERRRLAVWGLVAIGAAGCGGEAAEPGTARRSGSLAAAPPAAEGSDAGGAALNGVALSAPGSCDALLAALRADLFARTRQRAEQARESPHYFTPGANTGGAFEDPVPGGVVSDAPPPAPGSAGAPGSEALDVEGFEAADFVKADGGHLYVLDGAGEEQRLVIVRISPAQPVEVVAAAPIEGVPLELLVRERRVLVFSRLAGEDLGSYETFPEYEPVYTKLTVLDTGAGAEPPQVESELYLEGDYVFARQQGGVVRAVLQHFPKLRLDAPVLSDTDIFGRDRPREQIDAQVDAWVQITDASVLSSGLEAYLPGAYEPQGGALVARAPSCGSVFVPEPGRAEPGATSVVSLDLDAPDPAPSSFTVFGYARGVALDPGAAVLRQVRSIEAPGEAPRSESHLHLFELDATHARYAAAGRVGGHVTTVDRRAGFLRALSSQAVFQGDTFLGQEPRALTLAIEGSELRELGSTVIEAADNGIHAARFIGGSAYVLASNVEGVGFGEATTALVALDLSEPGAPREVGRLPLAGNGSVLVPLPGERLLSVTTAPDPDERGHHSELLLFDAAASAPGLAASFAWPPSRVAANDPLALSLSPDGARFGLPVSGGISASFDIFEATASGLSQFASIVPTSAEPTLVECLELRGQPADPDSIAAIEADPARLAATLEQCRATWPRPSVQRGLLGAAEAIVLSRSAFPQPRWTVAAYSLSPAPAAPLSQVDF